MRIFLGLGTNLGDRDKNLVEARDLLMKHDVLVMGQSSVLETEPLGGLDQPLYLNQVVECQTDLSPFELLQVCKTIEKEMGRPVDIPSVSNVRFGGALVSTVEGSAEGSTPKEPLKKWESRIIDLDILLYGDWILKEALLTIPHPGLVDRPFVVAGLCELAPDFVHPVLSKPLKNLLF